VHDVKLAEAEARRSVKELGAVALVLPNQQVNGRPWYDRYYDPSGPKRKGCTYPLPFMASRCLPRSIWDGVTSITFALAHAVGHPVEMMLALEVL